MIFLNMGSIQQYNRVVCICYTANRKADSCEHIVAYLLRAKARCYAMAQQTCLRDSGDVTQQ
jgi:hypothetical protein